MSLRRDYDRASAGIGLVIAVVHLTREDGFRRGKRAVILTLVQKKKPFQNKKLLLKYVMIFFMRIKSTVDNALC